MKSSPLFWLAQRRAARVAVGVILVSALVLVVEAAFVMLSGWAFSETILGGRIQTRTFVLAILMFLLSAALLDKYADRGTAISHCLWIMRSGFFHTCLLVLGRVYMVMTMPPPNTSLEANRR